MIDTGEALVLLSGGIDSAACAVFILKQNSCVRGLFIDYGQAAREHEQYAARAIAQYYSMPLDEIGVIGIDTSVGEIPGRNAFLISTAILATKGKATTLAIGIHDGTGYFDCSSHFLQRIRNLAAECTNGIVQVVAPFVDWSKRQIFDYCKANAIPVDLTYSCEAGTLPVCGECLSCRDLATLRRTL